MARLPRGFSHWFPDQMVLSHTGRLFSIKCCLFSSSLVRLRGVFLRWESFGSKLGRMPFNSFSSREQILLWFVFCRISWATFQASAPGRALLRNEPLCPVGSAQLLPGDAESPAGASYPSTASWRFAASSCLNNSCTPWPHYHMGRQGSESMSKFG